MVKQPCSNKKYLIQKNETMKTSNALLLFISVLIIGCDKNNIDTNEETDTSIELTDGFCIVVDNKVVVNHEDFEYYDYSNHLIYMKSIKSFPGDIKEYGTFTVFADKDEIYSGQLFPPYSTILPSKPVIFANQSMYRDYIIEIHYTKPRWDSLGNVLPDPREDDRIVEALKKYNQFYAGLSCEIKSVQYIATNNVNIELVLTNNDSINYYYLDPDKMGINLFHYFTHGLAIRDFKRREVYRHKTETIRPEPWNSWEKDWLSIIKGNESKTITITYNNFEEVVPGEYKATFEYPGLSHQVDKKDFVQDDGQIWLGDINMRKDITIE